MCTRASVLGARFAMFRAPRTQQARAGPWNRANPQELNSRNCRPQEPSAAASICRGHGRCAAATRGSGSQPSSNRPTSPGDGTRRPCERARSSGAAPRSCGRALSTNRDNLYFLMLSCSTPRRAGGGAGSPGASGLSDLCAARARERDVLMRSSSLQIIVVLVVETRPLTVYIYIHIYRVVL